jgi:thiosulfate dehydrogenase
MKFLAGIVLGLIIIPICGLLYFSRGMAPVATAAQPMPFEKRLANMALNMRVEKEMPKSESFPADENNLLAGATIYKQDCAVCHGLPGQSPTPIAAGMFPKPPQLFKGKGVTDDPPGATYWKVANGIRLTGMPAFKQSLSDQELWQVSQLLAHADKVPPSVHAALAAAAADTAAAPSARPAAP